MKKNDTHQMFRSNSPLRRKHLAIMLSTSMATVGLLTTIQATQSAEVKPVKNVEIDLDKAIALSCPDANSAKPAALKPKPLKQGQTLKGWVVEIPGHRPIATPTYWEGKLYVGGGYGSHEFYCFDAETGALIWQVKTKDDGPTAAVVENGLVAFNTESCTVMVLDALTGKVIWEEWLGDPLMSQPAINNGRLYIAYPSDGRPSNHAYEQQSSAVNQVHQQYANSPISLKPFAKKPAQQVEIGMSQAKGGGHVMLCADLKTGKHIWTQDITGDVQSAPVVNEDKLYFTCFDGTAFCLNGTDGKVIWQKAAQGTSAPLVSKGDVILSLKNREGGKDLEGVQVMSTTSGESKHKDLLAKRPATYLSSLGSGGIPSLSASFQASMDSSVGFSSAPAAAEMSQASNLLGVKTVVGAWAHQGSRSTLSKGQIMNAQGRYLNQINSKSGSMNWQAQARGKMVTDDVQVFSPPAVGKDKNLYLASQAGHLLSVRQSDGGINFMFSTGQPVSFQPALAKGNMYVGTTNGKLMCLNTGDADADGWYAWGGNAQHNKAD